MRYTKIIRSCGKNTSKVLNQALENGWCIIATYQPVKSGDDIIFVMLRNLPNLKTQS